MLLAILLLILSPFILWLLYWYYRYYHFETYLKGIPGPKALPLVGGVLEISSPKDVLPKLAEYNRRFKGNFKIYIGSQPSLFICEPKDLEFLLGSNTILTKSDNYRFLWNWLGKGLLTSTGDKWRKHRKIITPAFHFQILEEFIDIFNTTGDILISKLRKESENGSFDIYPYITRCALDIICETAMGTSVKAQDDLDPEYMRSVNVLLKVSRDRALSPILSNEFLYPFTKLYWTEREALRIVHGYTESVIKRRRQEFLNSFSEKEENVDFFGRKRKRAFLDLLLEYQSRDPSLTDRDVREEVDTFMFEGHDTTATSITFALHNLSTHPDVQKRAYEELQEIFSDDPQRNANHKDLQSMKYLEMVIKESLRMYTTIPLYSRSLEQDVDMNGVLLPKGMTLSACAYAVLHNPDLYEDPWRFDPERFTIENLKGKNPFAFIPFSAGARNCIGQRFAMLEMKALLSEVLRNFELLPAVPEHNLVLKSEAVLKSENGVFVRLKRRN